MKMLNTTGDPPDMDAAPKKFFSLPYVPQLTYKVRRVLDKKMDVKVVGRPNMSLKSHVTKLKDKQTSDLMSNVVYEVNCGECEMKYVGETKRRLKDRIGEHYRAVDKRKVQLSALAEHNVKSGHVPQWDSVRILDQERNWFSRRFKEARHIISNEHVLNRHEGMELPDVFKPLLSSCNSRFRAHKDVLYFLPPF